MTATYSNNLPTAKDRMRQLLGDTDMAAALKQDEEYEGLLAGYASETEATAVMAESLAAQFAQMPSSVNADGVAVSWADRVKTWLEIATRLRAALSEIKTITANSLRVVKPQHYNDPDPGSYSEYTRPHWVRFPEYPTE